MKTFLHCCKFIKEMTQYELYVTIAICLTIVAVALIIAAVIILWKRMEIKTSRRMACEKREWDNEDARRRQKNDLVEKVLDIRKENCFTYTENGEKRLKDKPETAIDKYVEAITMAIKGETISQSNGDIEK